MTTAGGAAMRRKLRTGAVLQGEALRTYIPRRRGARHAADVFSVALYLAKFLPGEGGQLAWDVAEDLAELVPVGCDAVACPPAGVRRGLRGFYFARELAAAVAQERGLRLLRPLRWAAEEIEGASKASHIRTQAGQGRKLARVAECLDDVTGQRVCLVDDLWTTGATAAACAEALYRAGAAAVDVVCLALTERTEDRPEGERERLQWRAEVRRARKRAMAAIT